MILNQKRRKHMEKNTLYFVDAIDKMDRIFRFIEERNAIDFMDLIHELGFSKSSAHRLVTFLIQLGYLEKNENGQIQLGIRLFELGYKMGENISMIKVARPYLEKLSQETGFVVHLGMMNQEDEGIFLDRIDSRAYTFTDTAIGGKMALYCSAAGKCLVAWEEPERIDRIISRIQFRAYTPNTITTEEEFRKELAKVRAAGYCIDDTEHEQYIKAIGVPIFNWSGKVAGALSLGAFKTEFDNMDFDYLLSCIKSAAEAIGKVIGPKK